MFAACLCVLLCPPNVLAVGEPKLEIVNPRPTYGYLGALRAKDDGLMPGDIGHFTFEIKNLKLDEAGKAYYSIAIEIHDAAGKLVFEQKPYNSIAQNFLGGNLLPCAAHVEVPLDLKPGEITWKLTVKDRTTGQTASIGGKKKVLPPGFGIVQVGLFADAEVRVPMSAVGVVGDSVYLRFSAIGFGRDKETKQPSVVMTMRIVDEKGTPTMARPIGAAITKGAGPSDPFLALQHGLTLNRAGRFTIELSMEDRVTGQRAQIQYAIRVLPLE